jgi:predicted exporter
MNHRNRREFLADVGRGMLVAGVGSALASVGLVVLFFALFRSLRLLCLAALPLGAGFVSGVAVCLALYGRVHGITLAFGASLLGVALDYVEHLYCHHAVAPHVEGPWGTLREIGPALVTGAVTTLVGFVALGFAGLPGLTEVAVVFSGRVLTKTRPRGKGRRRVGGVVV